NAILEAVITKDRAVVHLVREVEVLVGRTVHPCSSGFARSWRSSSKPTLNNLASRYSLSWFGPIQDEMSVVIGQRGRRLTMAVPVHSVFRENGLKVSTLYFLSVPAPFTSPLQSVRSPTPVGKEHH